MVVGKPLQVKEELTNGRLEYCPNILFTLKSLVLKSTRTGVCLFFPLTLNSSYHPPPFLLFVQLPLIAAPSREDIQEWHGKYVEKLRELHARGAKRCYAGEGKEGKELEVW